MEDRIGWVEASISGKLNMSEPPGEQATEDSSADAQAGAGGKIFVTGGSGFVGGHVVRELAVKGYEPLCLVRNRDKLIGKQPSEVSSKITVVEGSLFDAAVLERAVEGCCAAIHLVGIVYDRPMLGQTFSRIHVEATRNVIQACKRADVPRYVHMSALGARPDAISTYHQTKWFAEELVRQSGLDWTIFRPSIIHGSDGEFMQMMKFFSTDLRVPGMPYFGSGTNLVQPVSVRDVATCFVKSLSLSETIGQVYEIGGPDRLTWKELYSVCSEAITGRRRFKLPVPVWAAKIAARTVIPFAPSFIVPYKFNVGQVQMSQEDGVCDVEPIEKTFGIRLRRFREELSQYADQIR